MGFFQSLRVALACLAANKLRSVLTMLGVIIGVASVITMVSIIEGARNQVVKQFEEMGSRLIVIFFSPEDRKKGEGRSHVEHLTIDDAEAIRRECALVSDVSPELPMGDTEFEKIPTGALGLYTYYERLAQGLRQLMAGSRKFSLEYVSRNDSTSVPCA